MRRCKRCLLPETYPNIHFNDEGICNYCIDYQNKKQKSDFKEKERLKAEMEKIFEKNRRKGDYDCLVGLSGGKDSIYLLYVLSKQYGLKVLAYTCDNGFMSRVAYDNIRYTVSKLNVDHIFFKPRFDIYKKIFSYMIVHFNKGIARTICPICSSIYGGVAKKIAIQMNIPLIAFGWSPEQDNPSYRVARSRFFQDSYMPKVLFYEIFDDEDRKFFWDLYRYQVRRMIPNIVASFLVRKCPRSLFRFMMEKYPLVLTPYKVWGYNPKRNAEEIIKLGLIPKGNENSLATNCLMIFLMWYLDFKKLGYSPFVFEYSSYVREGKLDRQEYLEIFERAEEEIKRDLFKNDIIDFILTKLDVKKTDII